MKQTTDKPIKNLSGAPKRKFGGRQKGAGRPKGALGPKARTALEIKNRIAQAADNLLNAEMVEALGSFVVMKANPDDPLSYQRVTDEDEIIRFIQEHKGANGKVGEMVYILAAKDGNYKSRQYLFDRAFGRPAQAVEVEDKRVSSEALIQEVVNRLTRKFGYSETQAQAEAQKVAQTLYPVVSEANN